MTQEPVSSYLIVTTYQKQVDKLKLVEAATLFSFKNEHCFLIKEWISPESLPKKLLRGPKHQTKIVFQFFSRNSIYIYICIYYILYILYIYIYIHIYIYNMYIYIYILYLLKTALKLSLFEKFCHLNVKECAEDLVVHEMFF